MSDPQAASPMDPDPMAALFPVMFFSWWLPLALRWLADRRSGLIALGPFALVMGARARVFTGLSQMRQRAWMAEAESCLPAMSPSALVNAATSLQDMKVT